MYSILLLFQARDDGPEAVQKYFTLYYLLINIGSIVALAGVATLQQYRFSWGYVISTSSLLLSLASFIAGV